MDNASPSRGLLGRTIQKDLMFYDYKGAVPIFSREPQLFKRVCPSVGPSVRWSVGPLVMLL